VLAVLASRVGDWAVMTDELLYERLALGVVDGGAPRVRGELVDVFALLYPILLAPVFLLFSLPGAVVAAHAWNGILFASAAVPAYLLARRLAAAPWLVAVATVAIPWSVISGFLMTENAAYPAFVWAVLAIQHAAVAPGDRAHGLALVAVALATLARPQLAVLGLVLAVAVAVEELRVRRGVRVHRVLVGAAAVALAGAIVLALAGSLGSALGSYAPTVEEGSVLSREALRSAIVHLDVVAIAIGIVPLLVGGGWALEAAVRAPADPERRTFAVIVAASVVLLSLEVGSIVTRFPLGLEVKDRYLFYVVPLLFAATAVALTSRPAIAGLLAVTTVFVLTVGWEEFEPAFGVSVDSPGAVTHELLARELGDVGTSLAVAAGLVAVALVVALRTGVRLAPYVLGAITLLCAAETVYAWNRLLDSSGPSARPIAARPADELSWVDHALGSRDEAGIVPFPVGQEWFASAVAWWDVEFWNRQVTHAYVVGDGYTWTPESFPLRRLEIDSETGRIEGGLGEHVVRTTLDARFGPRGPVVATARDLELVRVEEPSRAAWLTIGLHEDGWTRANGIGTLRVFGDGETNVTAILHAPDVDEPVGYDLGDGRVGYLGSNETRELRFTVCGKADVPIRALSSSLVPDIPSTQADTTFRNVGVRLTRIAAVPTGRAC
jgi:hypothetical protein